ncbi:High mobility group nucleosome-binding domain-containing protein [Heracleum sosnowskyi]|uniref:High mobility group nucleosome-binding domain-containing protein n=1 Tax=Heracleum sosnowskyi TaxID=360622 RepID=A0AAD8MQF1_9APIA|nr:High mobility group nucleosome-binding domain-containing protein [Heracleum sosnowskyi]
MMIKYALLLTLFILVTFATNEAELKVEGGSSTNTSEVSGQAKGLNRKFGGSVSDLNDKNVDLLSKGKGEGSGEVVKKSGLEKEPDLSKQLGGHNVEAASNVEKKSSENMEKKVDKKDGEVEDSGDKGKSKEVIPAVRKENEECGLPDRCTAENDALVACLRVPGNESPELALLIQNKGKGPLDVKIIAPNFVSLEKQQIHLVENKHERVKVTVKDGGTDNLIILTAGNGNCSLSFKDLITQNLRKETVHTSQLNHSTYFNWSYWTTAVVFIILTAILLLASVWTCKILHRRHYPSDSSKYQKLDMELPVSDGLKMDTELHAGWDDSWGDSWDDEEAPKTPKTPSMPITPSFSSQGVSSRRINKDGWKD